VIIGLFCGFGGLIIVFIVTQVYSGDRATIPVHFFFRRTIFFSCMFSFCMGSAFLVVVYYLPFYFQGVKGTSAMSSGIRTLPFLLSLVILSVSVGGIVTVVGYYTPFMIGGMCVFAVAAGLLSTLSPSTPLARWFGYEVLTGASVGSCLQVNPRCRFGLN
jgi:Na+/melibiose symporter-like transporter